MLGRYRLLALLGQGGMADVYLATMHGKNAATPPADGFFDTEARFLGAFRDRADDWDSGWTASSP